MRIALAIVGFLVMPVVATAENLETTHLFGFTLGTDVNNVGEVEGELEAIGRFAKRVGVYNALSPTLGLKFIPFQNFSIEPGVGVAYHNISKPNQPQLKVSQWLGSNYPSSRVRAAAPGEASGGCAEVRRRSRPRWARRTGQDCRLPLCW